MREWDQKFRDSKLRAKVAREFRRALVGPINGGIREERKMIWQKAAISMVNRAICLGYLHSLKDQPTPCVDCGKQADHWEHRDYARPLEVEPCCMSCNFKRGPALFPDHMPKTRNL
jgi:hypothetical protein